MCGTGLRSSFLVLLIMGRLLGSRGERSEGGGKEVLKGLGMGGGDGWAERCLELAILLLITSSL